MNVWKDEKKQIIAEWITPEPEKYIDEVLDIIRMRFAVDEIDKDSFYTVPNDCGGTDSYLVLPTGGQVCLVEEDSKAILYLLSTE
ncbi:MAG: hypothetical protein FH756_13980 [Firmicutes bacterium]|nr:hypothetical protein [Bacillota bacterium]